jgi:hypothetical protein
LRFKPISVRKRWISGLSILILGILGWLAMAQWTKARTLTFVIPPGTSQSLKTGREIVDFPSELVFTLGVKDTLIVENQDDVVHAFGPFTILPHSTLYQRFKQVRVYQGTCTFHQERQMKLVIQPAPWDIFHNNQEGEQF